MIVLRARWILPISHPPINDGWIRLRGETILELGQGAISGVTNDLGDVVLLPGMVNAHTHLEFSDCDQPIGDPGMALADWIVQVVATRRGTTAERRDAAIARGITESCQAGVRLIGEIATPPCDYSTSKDSHAELVMFAEVLGLSRQRVQARLAAATEFNAANDNAAWSPHSPYSMSWEFIETCVERARRSQRPLAMHVAESPAERQLLATGSGIFADRLQQLGVWQDGLFPWGGDPLIRLIDCLSNAPRALLIHGNDLRPTEIERLAGHDHLSIVLCPRTHAFFDYEQHPVDRMLRAGVRVALGTDSRASNPDLNLWREVQFLLSHRADLNPADVIRMGTLSGAEALGRRDMGHIAEGSRPGLGVVPTTATSIGAVYRDLASHDYRPLRFRADR